MRALLLAAALLAGTNPGSPPGSGTTVAVTVPATVWNTPGNFALTTLATGDVSVVDTREGSPGWSITRQSSGAILTLTVLS